MPKQKKIPRWQWLAEIHPGHFVSVPDGEQPRGLKKWWLKLQGIEYQKINIGFDIIEGEGNNAK